MYRSEYLFRLLNMMKVLSKLVRDTRGDIQSENAYLSQPQWSVTGAPDRVHQTPRSTRSHYTSLPIARCLA